MALKKRGNVWWVDITAPNGDRVRQSARTSDKKQAQEYHDQLKAELWRVYQLGEKPRRLWEEAVLKWVKEKSHKKDFAKDVAKLKWLDPFLRGKRLDEISRDLIESIAEAKESEGVGPATVNRHLALIRSILRRAWKEWEWIDRVPSVRMRAETTGRVRFLTREEANKLLLELPEHRRDMAIFALNTGLRMSNVTGLRWEQVDTANQLAWVSAEESKNGKPIGVPLNSEALKVLERNRGKHEEFVFTYRGKAMASGASTKAWYAALKRAGIQNFRWHDLRHTWASWHVQEGTPLTVVQEMGAWSTSQMVQRYAHLTAGHLVQYAEKIAQSTNTAHP